MVNCTNPTLGLFSLGAAHLVFLLDSTVQSFLGDPRHFSVLDKLLTVLQQTKCIKWMQVWKSYFLMLCCSILTTTSSVSNQSLLVKMSLNWLRFLIIKGNKPFFLSLLLLMQLSLSPYTRVDCYHGWWRVHKGPDQSFLLKLSQTIFQHCKSPTALHSPDRSFSSTTTSSPLSRGLNHSSSLLLQKSVPKAAFLL